MYEGAKDDLSSACILCKRVVLHGDDDVDDVIMRLPIIVAADEAIKKRS